MRYLVWICVFTAYMLVFIGIFTLASGFTRGLKVETDVTRVVYGGQTVTRREQVEFNEIPVVRLVFGLSGLFITVGGGFMVANSIGRAWVGGAVPKTTKLEKIVLTSTFTVFFFAFAFLLGVETIFELFELRGILFIAATCAGANIVSALICKAMDNKLKANADGSGGMTV